MQRAELVLTRAKEALARGDHQTSRKLLSELLSLESYLGRRQRAAEAALLLADNFIAGADFDSAFAVCLQARELYRETADRSGQRAAVLAQAHAHHLCGNDTRAYALLSEELRIEEALGSKEGVRELQRVLLPIARNMGHAEAEERLLGELNVEGASGKDSPATAVVHYAFGEMFLHRGELDSAKERFRAAVLVSEEKHDSLPVIQSLMQCGIVAEKLKRENDALGFYARGLRLTDLTRGAEHLREEMLLRAGNIYIRQGRFESARKFFNVALRSAIKTQNKLIEAYSLLQLGHTYAGVRHADAMRYYNAGAALLSHIGLPRGNVYAQQCLGESALRARRFDEALTYLRNAAASEDSALAVWDDDDVFADCGDVMTPSRSPYDALIESLIQLGKYDEAYVTAERRNRLDAFRVLSGTDITTNNPQINSALEKFFQSRRNYVGAEHQLAEAFAHRSESMTLATNIQRSLLRHSQRLRDVGDSIAAFNKHLRAAVVMRPATVEEVQRSLPEGAGLVQYVPTARALYAFVLSRQAFSVQLAAVDREHLITAMGQYLIALQRLSSDVEPRDARQLHQTIGNVSTRLYDFFLRPIESSVQNVSTLFVVMPSGLPAIPLHSLRQQSSRGEYAIERWQIRYLSDADMLTLARPSTPGEPKVVAFGNPGRTNVDVEYELSDVRAFVRDFDIHTNRDASLERLQQARGDVLHLACDFRFNTKRPDNSFLVLTEGKEYAAETNVNLGVLFSSSPFSLVVFSDLNNEPITPCVPRLFRMNGAGEVVTNLYVPTRKAKKMYNELFYGRLTARNSTEVAYRGALLEMLKIEEFSQPQAWAAFSLW